MNDEANAKITLIPISSAEKFTIGSRYTTVACFEDEREKYPKEAWSLVVECCSLPNNTGTILANVRFLVAEAPAHLLHLGSRFELYEGRTIVASGEIILTP